MTYDIMIINIPSKYGDTVIATSIPFLQDECHAMFMIIHTLAVKGVTVYGTILMGAGCN